MLKTEPTLEKCTDTFLILFKSITSIPSETSFSERLFSERLLTIIYRKILELEEELKVVGNNLKSLEVSEEKVSPNLNLNCYRKCFLFG